MRHRLSPRGNRGTGRPRPSRTASLSTWTARASPTPSPSSAASPADLTWRAGVDALSFGGTKNGALMAEAVALLRPVARGGPRLAPPPRWSHRLQGAPDRRPVPRPSSRTATGSTSPATPMPWRPGSPRAFRPPAIASPGRSRPTRSSRILPDDRIAATQAGGCAVLRPARRDPAAGPAAGSRRDACPPRRLLRHDARRGRAFPGACGRLIRSSLAIRAPRHAPGRAFPLACH